ncbi:MAG TPA: hypothetical protein VHW73_02330 [Rudaea sp.]|jgi:hypothetical protein|nr:hypothetical protein [Rudaea sp.]
MIAAVSGNAAAITNSLSVTFTVTALPTSIVLCRDPQAYAGVGFDEQFQVPIDVDNNQNTGESGTDVLILLTTKSLGAPPCASSSPLDTANNLVAGLLIWNAAEMAFDDSGITPMVAFDFPHNAITISTPAVGVLAGLTMQSPIGVDAGASYQSGPNTSVAADATSDFTAGHSVTSPSRDVQFCTSPCSTASSYYNFIDLVEASATLGPPDEIFKSGFEFVSD